MGTNYYLEMAGSKDRLHIGKSSGGWTFALHVIPEKGLRNLEDWKLRWELGEIKDEYGASLNPEAMLKEITQRSWKREFNDEYAKACSYHNLQHFLSSNHAVLGPNGLLRCAPDSRHKHGEGTWDLVEGEFS